MRVTLLTLGAFLFLLYPVVLLVVLAGSLDQPGRDNGTAPLLLDVGAAQGSPEYRGSPRLNRHPALRGRTAAEKKR